MLFFSHGMHQGVTRERVSTKFNSLFIDREKHVDLWKTLDITTGVAEIVLTGFHPGEMQTLVFIISYNSLQGSPVSIFGP